MHTAPVPRMPITLAVPRLRSSDTRYNENVVKYGAGADLLIHEVAIARPELMSEAFIQRIMAHHTTAREAGMVFSRTKPKLAAYTHLVFLASQKIRRRRWTILSPRPGRLMGGRWRSGRI